MMDVSAEIICLSGKLDAAAFAPFNRPASQLKIQLLDERKFVATTAIDNLHTNNSKEAAYKCHRTLCLWVMCFNVGAQAHFDFFRRESSNSIFIASRKDGGGNFGFEVHRQQTYDASDEFLLEEDIKRAQLCFIAAAPDPEQQILDEYMKGLFHFSSTLYGIEFWKDAFSNFYRSFELFVTQRILKKKKLGNEVVEISNALRSLDVPEPLIEMFKSEVYPLRSGQVMHAQNKQRDLHPDDVSKAKLLCDLAMLSGYRPVWQATMASLPDKPTD